MPDYVVKRIAGGYRDLPIIVDPEIGMQLPQHVSHTMLKI